MQGPDSTQAPLGLLEVKGHEFGHQDGEVSSSHLQLCFCRWGRQRADRDQGCHLPDKSKERSSGCL